jgi:urease accessory protein
MARKRRTALLRAKGRPMVRDAPLPGASHHEAEAKRKKGALILRSRAKRGVSKDEGRQGAALYRLMAWLSPAYPVCAFSYSSGIEWAGEAGDIKDAETLKRWLAVMLADGSGFCDAVLFTQAHRAVTGGDDTALRAVAELAAAFAPSKERHLETTAQGAAFVEATCAAWPCAALDRLKAAWDGPVAYPVAVAVAAAGHGIVLKQALSAYLQALAANWVSAGMRLIPLGQTDGQRVLAALEPIVGATAQRALAATLDDIGSSAFRADLAGSRHETQYTRLFRS